MIARCINPNCGTPLHSFSEGRLFQFEVVSISVSATDETTGPFDEKPNTQTAQFWLCGRCAASLSLVLDPANGLKIVPLGTESVESNGVGLDHRQMPEANNC